MIGPVVFVPRTQTYATELKKWTIGLLWHLVGVDHNISEPTLAPP
jgi:hypothetical protein